MIGWIRYNRHEPPILVIHSYHHFILKERELKGKKIHFLVSLKFARFRKEYLCDLAITEK
jgi:hypothetical protein